MAHVPKTPNSKQASSHASSLHSTPGNPGASATARGLEDFKADEIRPLLMEDVKRFQLGNLDRYLHRILRAVNAIPVLTRDAEKATRPTDQVVQKELQECLNKVDEAIDTTSAEWTAIQDALKEYAKAKGEAERYSHFVNATNKILAILQRVNIGDTAPIAGDAIQFVVHDPTMIPSVHGGKPYGRKPDIVVSRERYISPLYRPLAKSKIPARLADPANPADTETATPAGRGMLTRSGVRNTNPGTLVDTTTPTSLDAQDTDPIVHSQPVSRNADTPASQGPVTPNASTPANIHPAPPASTPAITTTATSPDAPDPIAHLQSAPKRHLAWGKGLMFVEFKKRSKELNDPANWNPQIGSAQEGSFESAKEIELELQQNLKAKVGGDANLGEGASTSAVPSKSQAPSKSVKPRTVTRSRGTGGKSRGSSRVSTKAKNVVRGTASVASQNSDSVKKRKLFPADASGQGPQKKIKVAEELLVESATPAAVQLADYAAESLYNTFGRSHVLGLLVKDATINIWHFDHEAPLQMTGFDFLKHQHYLFLFLLALQRFDDKDWGFLPGFEKLVDDDDIKLDLTDVWVDNQPAEERKFTCKKKDIKKPPFGLGGRATGVMYGSVNEKEVVVKLSWPEKNRNREKEFVDKARERFNAMNLPDYNPGDYLPDILAAREYPEFESGPLRAAVLQVGSNYDEIKLGSRIPYFIVMPEYRPITDLTRDWDEFMAAFFALFYCHAMLWSIGIRHGDISETNLMWDPEEEKPKLCDFDLSHFCEAPQIGVAEEGPDGPMGLSNTGTWIFMADELLTVRAMQGLVKRVYRHEVETFVAVLVWIICRYKDGELRPESPLDHWNQATPHAVIDMRSATFQEMMKGQYPQPSELPDSTWDSATIAVLRMHKLKSGRAFAMSEVEELALLRKRNPRLYPNPTNALGDYDDLRVLPKAILSWPLFTNTHDPSAILFAKLMKERILNPNNPYTA